MKLHKILIGAFFAFALSSMITSCVDDWKFGDSFLDKYLSRGDVTKDTIFNNAGDTRDFLLEDLFLHCIMVALLLGWWCAGKDEYWCV